MESENWNMWGGVIALVTRTSINCIQIKWLLGSSRKC